MKYISIMEYAKVYGVHPNTVGTMLRMEKLKGEKVGRTWRIAVEDNVVVPVDNPVPDVPVTPPQARPDTSDKILEALAGITARLEQLEQTPVEEAEPEEGEPKYETYEEEEPSGEVLSGDPKRWAEWYKQTADTIKKMIVMVDEIYSKIPGTKLSDGTTVRYTHSRKDTYEGGLYATLEWQNGNILPLWNSILDLPCPTDADVLEALQPEPEPTPEPEPVAEPAKKSKRGKR